MVDVSGKDITKRVAVASGQIRMSPKAFKALLTHQSPKGNVLETARVAGVMAAKSTPAVIPLCHPLEINKVKLTFEKNKNKNTIKIQSEVVYVGRTGVEMEALMATTAAALTIYDMMKWADKSMVISDIKLMSKSGGKSGDFKR